VNISIFLKSKQVSAWSMSESQADIIREGIPGSVVTLYGDKQLFVDSLSGADVVIGWYLTQEWADRAIKLKILATPAAGRDYFSVNLPEEVICINGRFHGAIMAETALGMMLSRCRRICSVSELMKSGRTAGVWPREIYDSRARTLRGSRVVILGFGAIGKEAGLLAKALGANITGVNRSNFNRPDYFDNDDKVISVSELDMCLPEADHLLMVMPASAGSDHILDRARLALLKKDAGIYNIGRGNAIDEAALVEFLQDNPSAEAYLDVFATEPLEEDSVLRSISNLYLLPHASAIAPEYLDLFARDFCAQVRELPQYQQFFKD